MMVSPSKAFGATASSTRTMLEFLLRISSVKGIAISINTVIPSTDVALKKAALSENRYLCKRWSNNFKVIA